MVGKMLDQRAAVIAAELDEATRLRDEAAALLADYQKRKAAGAEAEARSHRRRGRAPRPPGSPKESRAALKAQIERRAAGRPGQDRPGRSRGHERDPRAWPPMPPWRPPRS